MGIILQVFRTSGESLLACVMSLVLFVAIAEHGFCQEAREQELEAKEKDIRKEIEGLSGHEWAGEYGSSAVIDSFAVLVIAPKSGYVVTKHLMASVSGRVGGSVSVEDGKLIMINESPEEKPKSSRMLVIDSNDYRYLVPYGQVHQFFLRSDDLRFLGVSYFSRKITNADEPTDSTNSGAPDETLSLPKELEPLRTLPRIETNVLQVLEKGAKVKLDKGASSHIYVGMNMQSWDGEITIESVSPDQSIGVVRTSWKKRMTKKTVFVSGNLFKGSTKKSKR